MERTRNMQTLDFGIWKRRLSRKKPELQFSENWIDTNTVCMKLNCSRATLRRKIKAGKVPEPSRHLGYYMPRWAESEIDTLMDSPKG